MVKVSIVLVSYNTKSLTLECLAKLDADIKGKFETEVFVVDNNSSDCTIDSIRALHPYVHLICNKQNLGFGTANNQAFVRCSGEFVLCINTDAFVHIGCVSRLVEFLKQNPEVAVAAPRVVNRDGSLQASVHPYPTPLRCWIENLWLNPLVNNVFSLRDWRSWSHDETRDVPWVIGACMLVRKSVIETVGGFDERFFMYSEETDWQYRIRKAGWKIWFVHDAVVTHLGGASAGTESLNSKTRVAFFESLNYFEHKNFGLLGALSVRAAMLIGSVIRICLWAFTGIVFRSKQSMALSKVSHYLWLIKFILIPSSMVSK